ncbi:MAG TPA: hypothetical protein VF158_09855 [Longimicrobiales bacterium]
MSRAVPAAAAALLLAGVLACVHRAPPSADAPAPPPPDLSGLPVMVLPVQPGRTGVPAGLEAELAYWLQARAPDVRWILPDAIDAALARIPTLDIRPRALAVSVFQRAEVRNIGDPLFGDLRRLGALVEARYAILPVAAAYVPRPEGERVEIAAAIIDTLGGRVLWYGIVAGEPGDGGSPAVVASAAQALARALFP